MPSGLSEADIPSMAGAIPMVGGTDAASLASAVGAVNRNPSTFVAEQTDYSTPTDAKLEAEGLKKIQAEQTANSFDALSRNIETRSTGGSIDAINRNNGTDLGSIGSTESSVQASAIPPVVKNNTKEFKVTITQEPNVSDVIGPKVVFKVMPTITESGGATYEAFTPLQHPGEILKYRGSSARSWSIEAILISRNIFEASDNLSMINTIRAWRMPFYGSGTVDNPNLSKYLGAPPPILTLTAYGDNMIGPVKCVLENYSMPWPNDVDYIQTDTGYPFPVIMRISLSLKESWSPAEYSGFDLLAYKNGDMVNAFTKVKQSKQSQSIAVQAPTSSATPVNRSAPTTVTPAKAASSSRTIPSLPSIKDATIAGILNPQGYP